MADSKGGGSESLVETVPNRQGEIGATTPHLPIILTVNPKERGP